MKNKILAVLFSVIILAVCLTPATLVSAESNRVVFEFKDIKIVNGEIAIPVYITENTGDIFVAKIKIAHDDTLVCKYFDEGDIVDSYDSGRGKPNKFKFNYNPNLEDSSVLVDSTWVGIDANGKGFGVTSTGYLGTFYFALKDGSLISDATLYTFSLSDKSEITSFDTNLHPEICFKESEQQESTVVEFKNDDPLASQDEESLEQNQQQHELTENKNNSNKNSKDNKTVIIVSVVGGCVLLAGIVGLIIVKRLKKH